MSLHQIEADAEMHAQTYAAVLSSEADHRIANNLALLVSLVRLRAGALARRRQPMTSEQVGHLLDDIANRIDTIARLHRILSRPHRQNSVDLAEYLEEICNSLVQSLAAAGRVVLRHAADAACLLRPDQVLPVGLIVSELMTNSVKYAHPTGVAVKVDIDCRYAADGTLVVGFADDGIGLPEGFDPMLDGGLGFRLVRSLAKQLNAAISFTNDDLGTCFRLEIPPPRHAVAAE